jgi:hypothetical protein
VAFASIDQPSAAVVGLSAARGANGEPEPMGGIPRNDGVALSFLIQ